LPSLYLCVGIWNKVNAGSDILIGEVKIPLSPNESDIEGIDFHSYCLQSKGNNNCFIYSYREDFTSTSLS